MPEAGFLRCAMLRIAPVGMTTRHFISAHRYGRNDNGTFFLHRFSWSDNGASCHFVWMVSLTMSFRAKRSAAEKSGRRAISIVTESEIAEWATRNMLPILPFFVIYYPFDFAQSLPWACRRDRFFIDDLLLFLFISEISEISGSRNLLFDFLHGSRCPIRLRSGHAFVVNWNPRLSAFWWGKPPPCLFGGSYAVRNAHNASHRTQKERSHGVFFIFQLIFNS